MNIFARNRTQAKQYSFSKLASNREEIKHFFQENDGLGDHEGLGTVKPVVDAIKLFFDEIFKNLVSPLDETTRILGHFKSNKQFKSKVLLKIELC